MLAEAVAERLDLELEPRGEGFKLVPPVEGWFRDKSPDRQPSWWPEQHRRRMARAHEWWAHAGERRASKQGESDGESASLAESPQFLEDLARYRRENPPPKSTLVSGELTMLADEWGLGYAELHSLISRPSDSVTAFVLDALLEALPPERGDQLRLAIEGEEAVPERDQYREMVRAELQRYARPDRATIWPEEMPASVQLRIRKLLSRLDPLGVPISRIRLAHHRVWDAALADQSAWAKLSEKEASKYLRAGYDREEALIRAEAAVYPAAFGGLDW